MSYVVRKNLPDEYSANSSVGRAPPNPVARAIAAQLRAALSVKMSEFDVKIVVCLGRTVVRRSVRISGWRGGRPDTRLASRFSCRPALD